VSKQFLVATFLDSEAVARAARALRDANFRIYDVHTPFPLEEVEHEIGIRSSRLGWITFSAGVGAALGALLLQFYMAVLDWPLNVGGKPANSTLAFIPITFELTVLAGALATVAALFVRARLFPGKRERLAAQGVTNDRFALLLRRRDASFDAQNARQILLQSGAFEIQERSGL
jgi:hypothetical protein